MYKKARSHFKKNDPKIHKISLEYELEDLKMSKDLFRDVVSTIIGQQLSGRAADTIFARFESLFPKKLITPRKIARIKEEEMRLCGLSGAKTRALKDLSQKVLSGEVLMEKLPSLSDEEVLTELTKVKGIGPWTAEMILMFSLGRADVFSTGDLVLRKQMMMLYGWKKMPSEKRMQKILRSWSPYRTYASRLLWKKGDEQKPGTMRKVYKDE